MALSVSISARGVGKSNKTPRCIYLALAGQMFNRLGHGFATGNDESMRQRLEFGCESILNVADESGVFHQGRGMTSVILLLLVLVQDRVADTRRGMEQPGILAAKKVERGFDA